MVHVNLHYSEPTEVEVEATTFSVGHVILVLSVKEEERFVLSGPAGEVRALLDAADAALVEVVGDVAGTPRR